MRNDFNKIMDIYIKSKNKYLYFTIILLFLIVTLIGKYDIKNNEVKNLYTITRSVYNPLDKYIK